jgi:cbb3-type cytochrome oxidase maturation protein
MEILYLLIPLSLVLVLAIGIAVWYAVDAGQFDDLDRPALDVVADDDKPPCAAVSRSA